MSDDGNEHGEPGIVAGDATLKVVEKALLNLWEVANELSRIRPERPEYYRVCIFGSARTEPGSALYEEVKQLARRLSALGCDIVTGGGPGLMQAANEGENLGDPDNHTRSYGVRVQLPFEEGANPFVEKLYTHRTFYSRLAQFMQLSSAFIVVSGGIGTTLETMMVWQLLQVRSVNIPLILVGPMWCDLVAWTKTHMLDAGLASPGDVEIPICVFSVDEAVEALLPHITAFKERPEQAR